MSINSSKIIILSQCKPERKNSILPQSESICLVNQFQFPTTFIFTAQEQQKELPAPWQDTTFSMNSPTESFLPLLNVCTALDVFSSSTSTIIYFSPEIPRLNDIFICSVQFHRFTEWSHSNGPHCSSEILNCHMKFWQTLRVANLVKNCIYVKLPLLRCKAKLKFKTPLSLVKSISRRNRKSDCQPFVFKRCLVNCLLLLRDFLSKVKGRKIMFLVNTATCSYRPQIKTYGFM